MPQGRLNGLEDTKNQMKSPEEMPKPWLKQERLRF
jgi:hypothetical protein